LNCERIPRRRADPAGGIGHPQVSERIRARRGQRGCERVMADQSTVVLPPEVFESFYRWLDTPAEEIPALARLARRERRIVQR